MKTPSVFAITSPSRRYQAQRDDVTDSTLTFTVDDAVNRVGLGWFQVHVLLVTGFFQMSQAFEMLLLAVLAPLLQCEWFLSDSQVALITTVVFVGMCVGSSLWGKCADLYGRRPIVLLAAAWITYMGFLAAFSPNYPWVLILRGLVGLGFGGAIQSFTIQAEYLPAKSRATILILLSFCWTVGSLLEMLLAYLVAPSLGWRWLVALSALPMFISLPIAWTMPESARYLVAAGQTDKALTILQTAAKRNHTTLPPGRLVDSKQSKRGRLSDLVCSSLRRSTLQVWCIWFGTAFSYYGIVILGSEPHLLNHPAACHQHNVSVDVEQTSQCETLTHHDYISMIVSTFGELVAIPISLVTINYLGRRVSLTINFCCSSLFFLLLQLCSSSLVQTVFIFGVRTFSSAIFTTVYIYTSEAYPTTMRSLALGTSSSAARVGVILTPFVAVVLLSHSITMAMCVYGAVNLLCALCAALLPIETKGREMMQSVT